MLSLSPVPVSLQSSLHRAAAEMIYLQLLSGHLSLLLKTFKYLPGSSSKGKFKLPNVAYRPRVFWPLSASGLISHGLSCITLHSATILDFFQLLQLTFLRAFTYSFP